MADKCVARSADEIRRTAKAWIVSHGGDWLICYRAEDGVFISTLMPCTTDKAWMRFSRALRVPIIDVISDTVLYDPPDLAAENARLRALVGELVKMVEDANICTDRIFDEYSNRQACNDCDEDCWVNRRKALLARAEAAGGEEAS